MAVIECSVTKMFQGLQWVSLKDKRTICWLTIVFKILNGEVAIPSQQFSELNYTITRHGHPKKLTRYQPQMDVLTYVFAPPAIPVWNDLPEKLVESRSIDSFRIAIWHHYFVISILLIHTCVHPSARMYRGCGILLIIHTDTDYISLLKTKDLPPSTGIWLLTFMLHSACAYCKLLKQARDSLGVHPSLNDLHLLNQWYYVGCLWASLWIYDTL